MAGAIRTITALCPTYEEFEGRKPTLDELLALIRRFSRDAWLSQLARLATLLADNRWQDKKYTEPFWEWFISRTRAKDMERFFQDCREKGMKAVPFGPRTIGIMSELVILHAPETAPRLMHFRKEKNTDEETVFEAFLMLQALIEKEVIRSRDNESRRQNRADMITRMHRSHIEDSQEISARAFRLYLHTQGQVREKVQELADAFEASTDVPLTDYLMGGLTLLARELAKSVDDLAKGWDPMPTTPEQFENPMLYQVVERYYSVRRATVDVIQAAIRDHEPDLDDPGSFNLIALHKYPIVNLGNGRSFCLYYQGLARSLLDGVYYAAVNGFLSKRINLSLQHLNALYGHVFEDYILDVLDIVAGSSLLKRPKKRSNDEEAADGIIIYPNGIVVVHIKAQRYRIADMYQFKSTEDRLEDLKRSGLMKAIEQMQDSIETCRNGDVDNLPEIDWTLKYIQPVIITDEFIPMFPGISEFLAPILSVIQRDQFIRWPVILNVADAERLPDRVTNTGQSFWDLITAYISDPTNREKTFGNFLYGMEKVEAEYFPGLIGQAIGDLQTWLGISGTPAGNNR